MSVLSTSVRNRIKVRRQQTVALGRELHRRYSPLFWALHSAWALVTGIVVLILAHNRYGFLPWVVLFVGLTWLSTLFFSKFVGEKKSTAKVVQFAQGFVSYITRVMYQETLFFLLPFYFYSTSFPSWNMFYVIGLAALAVLSCFDLMFDRLMREKKWFALGFFMLVTFSALLFFLPLVLHLQVHNGTYLAALASLLAALPLAYTWVEVKQPLRICKISAALLLVILGLKLFRVLVPPVPLRLTKLTISGVLDPRTLRTELEYGEKIPVSTIVGNRIYARATIFSPSRLPLRIRIYFKNNGKTLRVSRAVEITAHDKGFRTWDSLHSTKSGFKPGTYSIEVWTDQGQLLGRRTIELTPN